MAGDSWIMGIVGWWIAAVDMDLVNIAKEQPQAGRPWRARRCAPAALTPCGSAPAVRGLRPSALRAALPGAAWPPAFGREWLTPWVASGGPAGAGDWGLLMAGSSVVERGVQLEYPPK